MEYSDWTEEKKLGKLELLLWRHPIDSRHLCTPGLVFEGLQKSPNRLGLNRSIYSLALAQEIHSRPLCPEEIGCALSHNLAWQAFLERNTLELLVLEDDAEIGVALIEIVKHRVSFPDDWEIINFVSETGVDVTDVRVWDIRRVVRFSGNANRTARYLINRQGA